MQSTSTNKLETLNEAVFTGDLILLFAPGQKPAMLLVELSPGSRSSNPKASRITVRQVGVHYLKKPGYCRVSGPDVYFNKGEGDDTSDDDDTASEASVDASARPLSAYVARFPEECQVEYRVNPHGRDVLMNYWGGECPFCDGLHYYCPGCGPARLFPDLWGGCGVDQACPVCLGYNFAMDDKDALRVIEYYTDRLHRGDAKCDGGYAEMKREILDMVRERYESINAQREEMGFHSYDVNKTVEGSKITLKAPNEECWPTLTDWAELNDAVSGKLIRNTPVAEPCYYGDEDDQKLCDTIVDQWSNSTFQSLQPTGYCYPLDYACPVVSTPTGTPQTECDLGPAPVYTINATEPEDVAEGIQFAKTHNLRLVIRNTGHDLLGSLQIWLKYIQQGLEYHEEYQPPSQCQHTSWTGSAFTVRGGYLWGDLYAAAFERDLIVVGGQDPTVGVLGGYLQGGGHSPASRDFGLAVDQVLELKVVLASGELVTANACENRDLFFALRGGGGGTYGVVVSATLKAHPSRPAITHTLVIYPLPSRKDPLATTMVLIDVVAEILSAYPALSDGGFSGYGGWGIDKIDSPIATAPTPVMENGGYSHVFAKLDDSDDALEEAQRFVHATLMQRLRKYNGSGIMIQEIWERYPSFGDYYTAATRAEQQVGFSKMALTSRLLDKASLTGDTAQLKEMLRVTSTNSPDVPEKATIWTMLFLVGGGKVLNSPTNPSTDRYVGVHPAWRNAYLLAIPTSILPEDADDTSLKRMQHDTTYRKTDALRALAPNMGSYMNDGDRYNRWWQTDFFGDNYPRLRAIKDEYDPDHVFYCPTCVGSEEWREVPLEDKVDFDSKVRA
ncbi:hypothetical protein APSETT445_002430 [Aspergillus pseudonomiae]